MRWSDLAIEDRVALQWARKDACFLPRSKATYDVIGRVKSIRPGSIVLDVKTDNGMRTVELDRLTGLTKIIEQKEIIQ